MSFSDAAVWITGGGTGLGRAMAVEFARQGAQVAVSGRRLDRLEEAVVAIEAAGGTGFARVCDVTDDEALAATVSDVVERFGKLDVVVANAGFAVTGAFDQLTRDDWQRQFEVNVISAAMTAKFALPELIKTGGRVALIGSVAAWTPFPKNAPYSSSKAAVRLIGRTLSAELEPLGVSCTTIQPGFVESEIGRVDNAGNYDPERRDKRPKQLLWKTEDAARVMVHAICKRKIEYTFTGHGKFAATVARHAPWIMQLAATRAKL